jgi:hypothetical protein
MIKCFHLRFSGENGHLENGFLRGIHEKRLFSHVTRFSYTIARNLIRNTPVTGSDF